jgi:two-component system response regulator
MTVQEATTKSMSDKTILLVEDNPDDAELTLMALTRSMGVNNSIIAHDSVDVLRCLTETDTSSGYPGMLPTVTFFELNAAPADHAANSR